MAPGLGKGKGRKQGGDGISTGLSLNMERKLNFAKVLLSKRILISNQFIMCPGTLIDTEVFVFLKYFTILLNKARIANAVHCHSSEV